MTSAHDPSASRPGIAATWRELRRSERRLRWTPEEVARYQTVAVAATVRHAVTAVPFHRQRAGAGAADGIRDLTDLRRLPVTERHELAAAPIEARRSGPPDPRTQYKRTSGTTGQYLEVELSPRAAWWQGLLALRRNRARGVQPWHRAVAIRVDPDRRPPVGLLGHLAQRWAVLDAATDVAVLADEVARRSPVALTGFGHLLLDVGRATDRPIRPRVLGTGGQRLSPADRDALTTQFGTVPLDLYGTVETGSVAWQCTAGDLYHVDVDSVVVEVVDDDGHPVPDGENGDILVTTLANDHMPFLRYRVGDRGAMATRPCACGARWPALAAFEGRVMDRFVTSDGSRVASSRLFLSTLFGQDVLRRVGRYRVLQDHRGSITVEVVPNGDLPAAARSAVIDGYRRVLGAAVPVEVREVERIPLDPSGKLRQFVCLAEDLAPFGGSAAQ